MRGHIWIYNVACALLVLGLCSPDLSSSLSSGASNRPPAASLTSGLKNTETCVSTTFNYITHSLPQQCLATARPLGGSSLSDASTSGPVRSNSTAELNSEEVPTQSVVAKVSSIEAASSIAAHDITVIESTVTDPSLAKPTEPSSSTPHIAAETRSILLETPQIAAADNDLQLDTVRFLSFEEWKIQNLAQAGQSAEGLGQARRTGTPANQDRDKLGLNNGLDALGEDSEIELDFAVFGGPAAKSEQVTLGGTVATPQDHVPQDTTASSSQRPRSRDAGKTCKERFNYASFDCAANVLKTNAKCKSSSSILVENKDSYMLNECRIKDKFIIVELCEDILIDTLVLANFEFFSSMFRTFRVSVSDRYPVKAEKWKELGIFEARNTREIQAFLIENPLIWTRYLRLEFLTHYGSEFYCPVSLLRVHGTTMMEEYRREERAGSDADDDDDVFEPTTEVAIPVGSGVNPPVDRLKMDVMAAAHSDDHQIASHSINTTGDANPSVSSTLEPTQTVKDEQQPSNVSANGSINMVVSDLVRQTSSSDIGPSTLQHSNESPTTNVDATITPSSEAHLTPVRVDLPTNLSNVYEVQNSSSITSSGLSSVTNTLIESATLESSSVFSQPNIKSAVTTSSTSISTLPPTASPSSPAPSSSQSTVSSAPTFTSSSSSITPTSSPPHQPPTQESIFKSIQKRLQSLESNTSLSVQYIESQSLLLRTALAQSHAAQKQHLTTHLTTLLSSLNSTVSAELTRVKQDYDQLWQSTVIELALQREDGRKEREVLGERVRMLAEEMVGQKRVMAAQATALLVCAALLVFTRFGTASPANNVLALGGVRSASMAKDFGTSVSNANSMPTSNTLSPSSPSSPSSRRGGSWRWDRGNLWARRSLSGGVTLTGGVKSEEEEEYMQEDDGAAIDIGVGGGVVFGDRLTRSMGDLRSEKGIGMGMDGDMNGEVEVDMESPEFNLSPNSSGDLSLSLSRGPSGSVSMDGSVDALAIDGGLQEDHVVMEVEEDDDEEEEDDVDENGEEEARATTRTKTRTRTQPSSTITL